MPASPVLIPQAQGEQIPLSQINTNGPFSAQLAQPTFVAPEVRENGYGGPGHAILAFANNFLAGASQGRLRAFQQSEQTKKEHENNYDATVQHIMDSPVYNADFKEKVAQQALAQKSSAGLAALGGGKGGKNEHPMIGLARGVFNHIVGPSENVKHADIGPEHVSDLLTQARDPNNQFHLDEVLGQTNDKLNKLIQDRQATAKTAGTPLYQEDILRDPDYIKAVQPLVRQGLNPLGTPTIAGVVGALPSRPNAEQTLRMQRDQAELTHFQEQGLYQKGHLQREANMPVPWSWTGADGQPKTGSIKFSATGEMQDLDNNPIPAGDPRKTTGINANTGAGWTQGTRVVEVDDGNGGKLKVEVPTQTLHGRGTPPPPGAVAPGTPAPPVAGTNGSVQIPPVAPGQPGVQQLASKNNNPGNLMFANQPGAVLGENGFAKFQTPEAGLQALASNINANKATPVTLAGYISKYAPASVGNDTKTYVANAAQALGVTPDTALAQVDTNKLAAFQAQQESSTTVKPPVGAATTTVAPPIIPPGGKILGKSPVSPTAAAALNAPLRSLTPEEDDALRKERAASPGLDIDAWDLMLNGRINLKGLGAAMQPKADKIKHAEDQIMKEQGLTTGDILAKRAELKAYMPALTKLQTQATLINSFENTLLKNTEIAKQLSDAYARSDFPLLNKVYNAFKTGTGDPEAKNLAAQLHTMTTEWAKIMAGSTSASGVPITSAKQTDDLVGDKISNGQLHSFINNVVIPDAQSRKDGFATEGKDLLGKIRSITAPPQVTYVAPNGQTVKGTKAQIDTLKADIEAAHTAAGSAK